MLSLVAPIDDAVVSAADAGSVAASILPWLALFIVLVVGGGVVILAVRNWAASSQKSANPGFTIASLREMHERGEITAAEYERALEVTRRRVKSGEE
ncbi:MAG: SHOCT domain-containing protein [Planctomycetota bacterium]|nr:SHOCT domain-containing protein [Planctomycetota bacterium]MDA1105108.1 SHOCT domain-containing protein [Planctomycetota bacterium]